MSLADKRNINADAKLLAVFGKPQVTEFKLAGIAGIWGDAAWAGNTLMQPRRNALIIKILERTA